MLQHNSRNNLIFILWLQSFVAVYVDSMQESNTFLYFFGGIRTLVLIQSQAYYSLSQNRIRIDGSDSEGMFFSSLFDFGNTSAQGEISNRQLVFTGGVKQSQSSCFSEL